jgi:hypothetical protein
MLRHFRSLLFVPLLAACFLSSCGEGEKPFPVRTYNMGEKIELGHVIYQVFETQWLTHIGDGPEGRIPQNRFFLIRLMATNSGGADVVVNNVSIEDDNGTSYKELSDGAGVPQWAGYLRSVKPADSVQGNVLFDAPPRHYKLRITDETGDKPALVDIPLTFGSETPDIPTPGAAVKEKK